MAEVKSGRVDATYNYGEVLTPFSQPGQNWDRRIGYWRELAYKWRATCIGVLAVNALLALVFFVLLSGPQQSIWVSQVNPSGFVERSGWLNLNTPVPVTAAKHFMTSYLLSLNAPTTREQAFAKLYTDPKIWPVVAELQGANQNLVVDSVKPLGENRYELHWHGVTGNGMATDKTAEVSLKRTSPSTEAMLMQNPFGYIVTQFKGNPEHGK